jgi:hypothetical protein
VYLWGAQLEASPHATSYIPTTSAQATRAADVSSSAQTTRSADVVSVNTLSPWFNASEGTLFVEASQPVIFAASKSAASLSNGTNASRLTLYRANTSSAANGYIQPGPLTFVGPPVSAGVPWKQAIAYLGAAVAYSANGGAVISNPSTSLNAAAFNVLAIGNAYPGGGEFLNGHIRRVRYFPRSLSNSELQTLTT